MRPINLQIEGFNSFRERVFIDFSSLDLFAITGPTGAGKTSIIDSITYALYGCTPRIGEKQVSELISQGLNRVSVLFQFSSGKSEYRIARVGKWTGKQINTEVRLEQRVGDEWNSLASSVNQMKPMIEQIIGLDFNGFTKSVVLPQGRFDEFLKGKADDRRKILSDLLDLSVYSRMMRRANEMHTQCKAKATALDDVLKNEYVDATAEQVAKLQQLLQDTTPQLETIERELKVMSKFLPVALELRQAHAKLSKTEQELTAIAPKRKSAEHDLQRVRKRIEDIEQKLIAVRDSLKQNKYDSARLVRLSRLLEKAQGLEAVLDEIDEVEKLRKEGAAKIAKLDPQIKKLERTARDAAQACVVAQQDLERHRKLLRGFQKKYGSPDAIQSAIDSQKQLSKQEKAHAKLESELKSKEDERKSLKQDLATAESDAVLARERRDGLQTEFEALTCSHSAESLKPSLSVGEACPVCEQTVERLPRSRKHQPLDKARRELAGAGQLASAAETRAANLRGQVQPLQREAASLRSRIADSAESIQEIAQRIRVFAGADLLTLKTECETAQHHADDCASRLEDLKLRSADESSALKDHQRDRTLLENEIAGYTRQQTRLGKESSRLRDELGEFVNAKKLQAEVAEEEQARTNREELTASRDALSEQLSKAKDDVATEMAHVEGLETVRQSVEKAVTGLKERIVEQAGALKAQFPDLKSAPGERDEAAQLEKRSGDLQSRRDKLRKEVLELQSQINTIETKVVRAAELRRELEDHRTKMAVAKTLANSLQGDEFIDFIQKEAYARLAVDGSIHLKTLSGDRYSLSVDKDEFQVVDHWNADEPRAITTLSGGESFLASLALALALAEGLSGLSSGHTKFALESLFLDEGFGSLDPETLELVVAGIEGLSTNERVIGIVSHVGQIADRMPVRINVVKSIRGSTIDVAN